MSFCPKCGTDVTDGARFCPSCGNSMPKVEASKAPSDPMIGQKIDDKFYVEALLGVGGMGKVYKAVQLSLDKTVCVKVLHTAMAGDDTLARRFHREARAASRLNHPNSITVIDFGQSKSDGSLYLAMEFVPGKDLNKIIHEEYPLPEQRIVNLVDQVLSALADAHAAGIVHRDLKPENIMVTDLRGTKDFVKVLDFGIAKIQESSADPGLTQVGMVCGTPEYMSPEQARGEVLDARSDLYSAGVILYQMVVGKLPFTAPTAMGIVTKHLIEPPVPPSQIDGVKVSPALEAVILKAMSKDRNGRQPTALAFQQELNGVLNQMVAPAQALPQGQSLFDDPPPQTADPTGPTLQPPPDQSPAPTMIRSGTEDVRAVRAPAAGPQGAPAGAAPSAPKKGGAGLIIGLIVAVLVLGGGAAAYFLYFKDKGGAEVADAGVVAPKPDAGAVVQADAGAVTPPPLVDAGQPEEKPDAGSVAIVSPPADQDEPPPQDAGAPVTPKIADAAKMHYQAGKELMAQGKYSKAIPAFGRAIKISPDYADAYKALGTCFISTGNTAKAKANYKKYLEKKPDAADREEIQSMIDTF